jgi:hypothetical protein
MSAADVRTLSLPTICFIRATSAACEMPVFAGEFVAVVIIFVNASGFRAL